MGIFATFLIWLACACAAFMHRSCPELSMASLAAVSASRLESELLLEVVTLHLCLVDRMRHAAMHVCASLKQQLGL